MIESDLYLQVFCAEWFSVGNEVWMLAHLLVWERLLYVRCFVGSIPIYLAWYIHFHGYSLIENLSISITLLQHVRTSHAVHWRTYIISWLHKKEIGPVHSSLRRPSLILPPLLLLQIASLLVSSKCIQLWSSMSRSTVYGSARLVEQQSENFATNLLASSPWKHLECSLHTRFQSFLWRVWGPSCPCQPSPKDLKASSSLPLGLAAQHAPWFALSHHPNPG